MTNTFYGGEIVAYEFPAVIPAIESPEEKKARKLREKEREKNQRQQELFDEVYPDQQSVTDQDLLNDLPF